MNKQTVRDIDVKGKRALVRVDYNVPIKNGEVGDTLRIQGSFETINYLLEQGSSLVLMSHLGEPKGKVDPALSLEPVAAKAAELLGKPIAFYHDCIGDEVDEAVKALQPGQIMMLENVRFHPEELDNDHAFAEKLASYGDIYVNDSFAVDHRDQVSVSGIAAIIPGVAGFLVEKEVNYIKGALDHPNRPLVAVIGGAKVSSKIEVLENLIPKVDVLMIGGAMANTFYLAADLPVGKSLVEPDFVAEAKRLVTLAKTENCELILPGDVVVSNDIDAPKDVRTIKVAEIKPDQIIVDAAPAFGPEITPAVHEFLDFDNKCTVIWNGPIGVTEVPEFALGSRALADAIIALPGVISIIGGGDTAAFIDDAGLHDKFTWVSTGGGASLELMSGKTLPGIAALLDKK
ncbi:phosphoglycerate kinase [Candidatus Saccharibacteria bacterium]|nr:phosphoglycerate kinase [Candidatus Saccharibacteria bacterium]